MSPFISLNSWNEPGAILQAAEPEEIVTGGPEDWGKLKEVLARRRKTGSRLRPSAKRGGRVYSPTRARYHFAWFPKDFRAA